ncbi:MAG TPA: hypothetical protein VGN20_10180 [Mucilaginibacter sp.]|jgi:hypothetical protein
MRRWIIIFGCCGLLACYQNKKSSTNKFSKKKAAIVKVDPKAMGLMFDTLYLDHDITKIDTIRYLTSLAKITPLPFGYDFKKNGYSKIQNYNDNLIYKNVNDKGSGKKNDIYKLPPITRIKYFSLSWVDTDKCNDEKPFVEYLRLTKYRYKLPNINGYECYYWCDEHLDNEYPSQVYINCGWCFLYNVYGYLILYNRKKEEANVVALYFDTPRDGINAWRYFYIDKNYVIHLEEREIDNDEGTEWSPADKHIVSISKTGEILSKRIN